MGGYHGVMLMKALDFKYSRSGANAYFEGGMFVVGHVLLTPYRRP